MPRRQKCKEFHSIVSMLRTYLDKGNQHVADFLVLNMSNLKYKSS